jgi:hypothetical protein
MVLVIGVCVSLTALGSGGRAGISVLLCRASAPTLSPPRRGRGGPRDRVATAGGRGVAPGGDPTVPCARPPPHRHRQAPDSGGARPRNSHPYQLLQRSIPPAPGAGRAPLLLAPNLQRIVREFRRISLDSKRKPTPRHYAWDRQTRRGIYSRGSRPAELSPVELFIDPCDA